MTRPTHPTRRQLLASRRRLVCSACRCRACWPLASDRPHARAKTRHAVIFLRQFGETKTRPTQPATETTNAPDNIHGEFEPIATRVPGLQVCEQTDKICPRNGQGLRRACGSMRLRDEESQLYRPARSPWTRSRRWTISHLRDTRDPIVPCVRVGRRALAAARPGVPSFVAFPHVLRDGSVTPGQHASFLGKACDPLLVTQDPNDADFRLPELSLPAGLSLERLENRREIQRLIDGQAELLDYSAKARGIDATYVKALSMLTSPRVRRAFDLSSRPEAVRGLSTAVPTYGQSCLLARRLVEAGVRFVNVYFAASIGGRKNNGGWDTHGFDNNPIYACPSRAISFRSTEQNGADLAGGASILAACSTTTLVLWMR